MEWWRQCRDLRGGDAVNEEMGRLQTGFGPQLASYKGVGLQ